jgi:hypothetical protein
MVAAAQFINILDSDGRTQSIVELEPNGTGIVKVFVSSEELPNIEGIQVSLLKLEKKKDKSNFGTATTYKDGIATFFEVPGGDYEVHIGCDQYSIDDVQIIDAFANLENAAGVGQLNIVDTEGQTRAISELPIGTPTEINVSIGSSTVAPVKDIAVTLVEMEGDVEKEALSLAKTDEKGLAHFTDIFVGNYRVKFQCPKVNLAGVGASGKGIVNMFCATSQGGVANAISALGTGGVSTGASVATSAAITTAIVAPPLGIGINDAISENPTITLPPITLPPTTTIPTPPTITLPPPPPPTSPS